MASKDVAAAAARSAAAVATRSAAAAAAAARHVASDIRRLAPRFPRRGLTANTIPTAGWTRPALSHPAAGPSGPRLLRRGLAIASGGGHSHGYEDMPRHWFDPEAPVPGFDYGEEDLASEESMWALYERWCSYHEVKRSRDDMLRRFGTFKDRARRIHEFNKSGASFTMGLNDSGDQTAEERASRFLGRGP